MTRNCDIAFETLVDYVEGKTEDRERLHLESHVAAGCLQCERSIGWLRRATNAMRTDTSARPPAWVIERARRLFREPPASRAWTRRIVAFLCLDSGLQVGTAGIRSGTKAVRQLLYSTPEYDVDFILEEQEYGRPEQAKVIMSGQILPRGNAERHNLAYELSVTRGEEIVFSGRASELGEFAFDNLTKGKYDLHISVEEGELFVEGLEI